MPLGGHQASGDNAGPAINTISWFFAATAFLTVTLRTVTKGMLTRLAADDILIFISLALYLSETVAVGFQVDAGLGQHSDNASLSAFQKAAYAEDVLFTLILASSKMSVLVFFRMLSPAQTHRMFIKLSIWIVSVWAIASCVVTLFQCQAPAVWAILYRDTCLNRAGFMASINAINIIFDVALIVFPIRILARMQTSLPKKSLLIACFLSRVIVIGALITETALQLTRPGGDATWNDWPSAVVRQVISSTSIIVACIPYYVSWVPHAFRIYATVGDNKIPRNPRLIRRPKVFSRRDSSSTNRNSALLRGEAIRAQSDAESQPSNHLYIRKTTEWRIQSERGSQIINFEHESAPTGGSEERLRLSV